jgi:hypothetical protein
MPTNAYFWEGDRLVIMPDIADWSIDVHREFVEFGVETFPFDARTYAEVGRDVRVRIRPRRIYVNRRLEPGDSGALRIFCEGRDYRVASAVLMDVIDGLRAEIVGGRLDFQSSSPVTIAERPLRAR